ncbi:MAG: 50S ribosomal protein L20 [Rickettsiales bacterium]|nr:50S ribosomal protein L20 [Rickettsiales bacterium]
MSEHTISNFEIQTLVTQGLDAIGAAASSQALQDVRVQFLGKSGSLAAHPYFQTIKDASPEQKKIIGADRTAATSALTAAAREHGMVYSEFMHGLNLAGITLDRKALADIAVQDAGLFKELAAKAQAGAKQKPKAEAKA